MTVSFVSNSRYRYHRHDPLDRCEIPVCQRKSGRIQRRVKGSHIHRYRTCHHSTFILFDSISHRSQSLTMQNYVRHILFLTCTLCCLLVPADVAAISLEDFFNSFFNGSGGNSGACSYNGDVRSSFKNCNPSE